MTINRRLSAWTLVSLCAVGVAGLLTHYCILSAGEGDEYESLGNTVGPIIEESLSASMISRDMRMLNKTLLDIVSIEPISRILLVNSEGTVKAGTETKMIGMNLSEAESMAQGSGQAAWIDDASRGERMFRWTQAVRNRPECHGCHNPRVKYNGLIVVDFSGSAMEAHLREHIGKELLLMLVSFLLVGGVLFRLTDVIVIRRLDGLLETVKKFKGGDFGARIALVAGNDELSRLGTSFNDMAASIAESHAALQRYADELLSLAIASNVVTAVPRTENIYEATCNIAMKELGVAMAWIGVPDRQGKGMEIVARCGGEKSTADGAVPGWRAAEVALAARQPQILNERTIIPVPTASGEEAAYRSSLALPLFTSEGEMLGVLSCHSVNPQHFTKKRTRMFLIFANQAAAAIENRKLIEDVETKGRELAEQYDVALRSQKEWRLTFDSITDLISIHDRNYRVIKANRAFMAYFGISPKDLKNRRCHEVFHGLCAPLEQCPHRSTMKGGLAGTEEFHDPKTGRTFQVCTYPYYSPEGEYIGSVHIAKDVTDVREKELRLIMTERLASLGQMASGLAHEINNPLASIAGCTEGLLMKIKNNRYDAGLFAEYLTIIEEEVRRCKHITTGMLSFVRKSSYETKAVSINEVMDKTLEIISFQGRLAHVVIDRRYAPETPIVSGSEGELRQVFLSVITNALDAMEDRGTLTVATAADTGRVRITIADTGPGIAAENLTRIFDPFFTTKSERGGTGLGLSIAHRIIRNHGGEITVESEAGSGTRVAITLLLTEIQEAECR